jgi:uncharacterized cupredoxin-like copper-binding protein
MRLARLALVAALSLIVATCSAGASNTSAPSSSAGTRIEVKLTDALRIEPATMRVPVGQPVTFVVTNTGASDHEFYVGDEQAQAEHEKEMAAMGGMAHDEEMGIGVKPGQTKELTITFPAAGTTLAGCHVAGHYGLGMKATIEIAA